MSISKFQFQQMIADKPALVRPAGGSAASRPVEKKLHEEIIAHCNAQWPRWKFVHSRMDKATRNEPGVPDFIIAMPHNRVAYVEAKRIGEKVSPAQRDWHAEMALLGHTVFVVHTLEEFLAVVTNHKKK